MTAPPEFDDSQPERLSIAHLLVWTAMSAVLLGYQRALTSIAEREQTLFSTIVTLWYAPLFGAGLGACALWFWRATQGGPRFPVQPGHWLLIIGGVAALISLTFQAASLVALAGVTTVRLFIAIRIVEFLAGFILFVLAFQKTLGIWRWAFGLGILQTAVMLILCTVSIFGPLSWYFASFRTTELTLHCLVSIMVLFLAGIDRARHEPRDYLHWTGVIVRLIYSALIVAIPWLFRWLQKPPS